MIPTTDSYLKWAVVYDPPPSSNSTVRVDYFPTLDEAVQCLRDNYRQDASIWSQVELPNNGYE